MASQVFGRGVIEAGPKRQIVCIFTMLLLLIEVSWWRWWVFKRSGRGGDRGRNQASKGVLLLFFLIDVL